MDFIFAAVVLLESSIQLHGLSQEFVTAAVFSADDDHARVNGLLERCGRSRQNMHPRHVLVDSDGGRIAQCALFLDEVPDPFGWTFEVFHTVN